MDQVAPSQTVNASSEVVIDNGEEEHHADAMGAVIFENEGQSGYFGASMSLILFCWILTFVKGPSSNIFFLRAIGQVMLQASNFTLSSASANSGSLNVSRRASIPTGTSRPQYSAANTTSAAVTSVEEDKMIDTFFTNTGYLFPYIHEARFRTRLGFMRGYPQRQRPPSWSGLLNIVFAMAISTNRSCKLDALERSQTSEIYAQKALYHCKKRMMQGDNLETGKKPFSVNDIMEAQLTGKAHFLLLLGQYLQGTQKPSEAWTVSGLAVKVVLQLGLHSNAASAGLSAVDEEIRKRTWLACVSLDRTMSMTFGRPSSIPGSYVKVSAPTQYPQPEPSDLAAIATEQKDPSNVSFFAATV